ncbi:hypothetical protein BDN71DRAFT_1499914 [Pleurotus eryngii]|uniref:Uncharacterized protein n=1 Tax=Pleurotus eryngii TaxID=5323 RepID=A0A9P5ZHA8_PLEER|nr:hypothetical protein BDN71DRAFT_1499914 [Pleurotus eryngii]
MAIAVPLEFVAIGVYLLPFIPSSHPSSAFTIALLLLVECRRGIEGFERKHTQQRLVRVVSTALSESSSGFRTRTFATRTLSRRSDAEMARNVFVIGCVLDVADRLVYREQGCE